MSKTIDAEGARGGHSRLESQANLSIADSTMYNVEKIPGQTETFRASPILREHYHQIEPTESIIGGDDYGDRESQQVRKLKVKEKLAPLDGTRSLKNSMKGSQMSLKSAKSLKYKNVATPGRDSTNEDYDRKPIEEAELIDD